MIFFELGHLRSTSSVYVIKKLKGHFARHGIPEKLVTDNGPQFVSWDFLKFSKEWDFEHRTSSPRHSQSNGKTESAVKQAKKILLKCSKTGSDTFLALLETYRLRGCKSALHSGYLAEEQEVSCR